MRKWIVLCLFCALILPLKAQWQLSKEAKISILTSAPHDEAVFTVFGHAAFRVHDPAFDYDMVFNYGIFDFSKPNFILRFALGETDYKLAAYKYDHYIAEYQMRGSDVTEQILNLDDWEINQLFAALMVNLQPENRVYRYNFFFDNCATRLPAMVERVVDGKVVYHNPPASRTFRQLVHGCTKDHPWLTFGIDLALGSPTDRPATPCEMMFLPEFLKEELAKATIQTPAGKERPLVSDTHVIKAVVEEDARQPVWNTLFTPLVCGWLLFAVVVMITLWDLKKKRKGRLLDFLLFAVAGIAGCVLFFLCFVSVHPGIWPNWSVLWLHPLHLVAAILFYVKKARKTIYYYHFINFAALLLMLIGWFAIPQQMNAAFIPLIATLALRSGWNVLNSECRI